MRLKGDDITENLSQRYATAFTGNGRWFNQLLDAVRYASPSQDGMNILYEYDNSGTYLEYYVHNTVPQIACDKRASDLHSLLLPAGQRWLEIYENGQFDDDNTEKVFRVLQESNIHSIAHTIFMDLNIGTAGIWIDSYSKERPLVFKALTGVAIMPEYSDDSNNDNVWFKRAVNDQELASMGRKVVSGNDNKNFITCGFLKNRDLDGNVIYDVPDADRFEFIFVETLNDEWKEPLTLEARRYKQLHLINDNVRAGDTRGRGVVLKMLQDIVYLNEMTGDLKTSIKMKSKPPIMINPRLGNVSADQLAGGILPSALDADGKPMIQPLEFNVDIESPMKFSEMLEDRIKTAFNVEPLGNLEAKVRSATEVEIRQQNAQRQSLTDISKILYDLNNVFSTCFDMLKDRGIIKKSGNTKITFRNPTLERENQLQINNLAEYKQLTAQIINPNWSSIVNDPLLVDAYIKEKLMIPQTLQKSSVAIQQGLAAVQKMAQQMQQGGPGTAAPTNQPDAISSQAPMRVQGMGVSG
jgi:hypothetical protein